MSAENPAPNSFVESKVIDSARYFMYTISVQYALNFAWQVVEFMVATILYIEDNPDNLTLVRRVVEAIGCTFVGAGTGGEGLRQAALLEPDLILLDINLPDIDGYSIARRMRSSGDPHLVYVPIIAVTANAMRGEANKALEAGCDIYMSKPINIRELRARIEAFLEITRGAT